VLDVSWPRFRFSQQPQYREFQSRDGGLFGQLERFLRMSTGAYRAERSDRNSVAIDDDERRAATHTGHINGGAEAGKYSPRMVTDTEAMNPS
jgi:hypothetical protein